MILWTCGTWDFPGTSLTPEAAMSVFSVYIKMIPSSFNSNTYGSATEQLTILDPVSSGMCWICSTDKMNNMQITNKNTPISPT